MFFGIASMPVSFSWRYHEISRQTRAAMLSLWTQLWILPQRCLVAKMWVHQALLVNKFTVATL